MDWAFDGPRRRLRAEKCTRLVVVGSGRRVLPGRTDGLEAPAADGTRDRSGRWADPEGVEGEPEPRTVDWAGIGLARSDPSSWRQT